MNIQVNNCNNIDLANLNIYENKLNIKLASNGTGKSTIATAIEIAINRPLELQENLLPFKYRENNPENIVPEVKGIAGTKSVMCFNEKYVRQFSFQKDELVANSFDILIRTDEYKKIEGEIEILVSEIRKIFSNNEKLENLIVMLKELSSAFKLTKSGVSMSSTGMKGLKDGNKIKYVPKGLEQYKPFIQCNNSVNWIAWQLQGADFIGLSENCPFCTSDTKDKKQIISKVSQEYDKNTIKNLVGIIEVIEKLGDYLSAEAKYKMNTITNLKNGLEKEHISFIVEIKTQIENFIEKLNKLKNLSSFQFMENMKVADELKKYILDLEFFAALNSIEMKVAIEPINSSLFRLIDKAGELQGKINQQRSKMKAIIAKHQNNINEFLSYAGYKYEVEIAGLNDESKLRLKHVDYSEHLVGGDQFLSYGERNAFSIILFMYECLSKKPDIIILDDPISSFDKNKKYAILEMLFRRDTDECFKNKTVIMLTHDIEPIIDTVKSLSNKFKNLTKASFLKIKKGIISELDINKSDIKTFAEICTDVIQSSKDEITKLIYLRRKFEIININCDGYQVLSNLFHKRVKPIDKREEKGEDGIYQLLSSEKFKNGCDEIREYINSFDYEFTINRISDFEEVKKIYYESDNGYEKLQLFRILEIGDLNSVIQKFINETYHIENEYICQLNPSDFDTIPEYVIDECNNMLKKYSR